MILKIRSAKRTRRGRKEEEQKQVQEDEEKKQKKKAEVQKEEQKEQIETRRPLKVLKSCFCNRFHFYLNPYIKINRKLIALTFL